jgi:hypothetical protein
MVPRRKLRLQQGTLRAVASCNPELQVRFANPDKLSTTGLRACSYLKTKRTSEDYLTPATLLYVITKQALSRFATAGLYCLTHFRTSP